MLLEEYKDLIDQISMINEDEEIPIAKPEEKPVEKEDSTDPANPRQAVSEAIKAQVEIASSMIDSIKDAFEDECGQTKKIGNMEDQIKNWEKTIRGACQQIVAVVENKKFVIDKTVCSPRAYKKIQNSSSRDLSVLDLCAAIIVFHNSLD